MRAVADLHHICLELVYPRVHGGEKRKLEALRASKGTMRKMKDIAGVSVGPTWSKSIFNVFECWNFDIMPALRCQPAV